MGVDIAVCVVVFISAVCYAHIGFVRTVISLIQWVACLACGLFFADDIKDFIYKIGIGKNIFIRTGKVLCSIPLLRWKPAVNGSPVFAPRIFVCRPLTEGLCFLKRKYASIIYRVPI